MTWKLKESSYETVSRVERRRVDIVMEKETRENCSNDYGR